jgi:histidine ammonia-lyase
MPHLESVLTTELNSANDNPLFDPETGDVLHGGHFYGGHACYVADTLKTQVANLADLMDRQFATLVDTKFSNGLPSNLSGATGDRATINHGLKAVQIAVSAWTAEACKLTMPASVFSRSTECHNQDKVSMGTIAARDALRVTELTAQIAAAHALATTQAIDLRLKTGELTPEQVGPSIQEFVNTVRNTSEFISEDRPLDADLRKLTDLVLTHDIV